MGRDTKGLDELSKATQRLIDFTELRTGPAGQRLEYLVRDIGCKLGFEVEWTGSGPDGGKDLLFVETHMGVLSSPKTKWLVSCKDFSKSGALVGDSDLGDVVTKVAQHGSDGFLLVATTGITFGAKNTLDALPKAAEVQRRVMTQVWDDSELESMLLLESNIDILKKYLPESFKRIKSLSDPETILLGLRDKLPGDLFDRIAKVIRAYAENEIKGSQIFPDDSTAADSVDKIIYALLVDKDFDAMANATVDITPDQLEHFITRLTTVYRSSAREYLKSIVTSQSTCPIVSQALILLNQDFGLSWDEKLELCHGQPSSIVAHAFEDEVWWFVKSKLMNDPWEYSFAEVYSLGPIVSVDEVLVDDVTFDTDYEDSMSFHGKISVSIIIGDDEKEKGHWSHLDGDFEGHLDESGLSLDSASVDINSWH